MQTENFLNGEVKNTKDKDLTSREKIIAALIVFAISFFGGRATAYIEAPEKIEATSQRLSNTVKDLQEFKNTVNNNFQKIDNRFDKVDLKLDLIFKKESEKQ